MVQNWSQQNFAAARIAYDARGHPWTPARPSHHHSRVFYDFFGRLGDISGLKQPYGDFAVSGLNLHYEFSKKVKIQKKIENTFFVLWLGIDFWVFWIVGRSESTYPLDITSALVWKVFCFIHDAEPKATQMKLTMFRIEFIFSHIDTKASEVVINIVWIKSSRKESGSSLTFKTL